MFFVVFSLRYN